MAVPESGAADPSPLARTPMIVADSSTTLICHHSTTIRRRSRRLCSVSISVRVVLYTDHVIT